MAKATAGKSISEDCLEFYDDAGKVGVNLVPFEKAAFIPRVGEIVYLPGQGPKYGEGTYRVTKVQYHFLPDNGSDMSPDLGPAALKKVTLHVERI